MLIELLLWLAVLAPILPMLFWSGCCCSTCTYGSDSFDRADDTDIDTGSSVGWTEQSGSWSIASNKLACTSAGIATCDTTHPDSDITVRVSVTAEHSSSFGHLDVIMGWESSSKYWYARIDINADRVYIRAHDGSDTTLAEALFTATASTPYDITVCVSETGNISASVGLLNLTTTGTAIATSVCGLRGFGTGTATFDNFALAKGYNETNAADCDECITACPSCVDSTPPYAVPQQYQVTISGVTGTCNGDPCSMAHGIWVLDLIELRPNCCWGYRLSAPETFCYNMFGNPVMNSMSLRISGSINVLFYFGATAASSSLCSALTPNFQAYNLSDPDAACSDYSSHSLNTKSATTCDVSGASFLVDAI